MGVFSGGEKMTSAEGTNHRKRKAFALVTSMIFVVIFSVLAISIATMSGTNVQIAQNEHKTNCARACAESGLEIMRYWLSQVSISGTTPAGQRLNQIANSLQNELSAHSITNVAMQFDNSTITIPSTILDSAEAQSFSAVITQINNDTLQMDVTGTYRQITRSLRVNYEFRTRANTVFDFGVATKGPLSLTGNVDVEGVNVSIEANTYIESPNSLLALSITGNSQIAGDVSIANSQAYVDLQGGQAGIGGETGQAAVDNHVDFGVPPTEFPEPNPGYFEQFVTNIVDCNTNTSADAVFENIRIQANTDPSFTGHVTLKGVVFIETPNIVTFAGSADVIAVIVGDGDLTDDSGANHIRFLGNVSSLPVSELPDEQQFAGLRDETGTFVMAPGFKLSFGGSFDSLSGAIASSGVEFFGNAGGIVNGSIINYSDEEMTITGNSDLYFNRSGTTEVPAGFVPELVLRYEPASYSEVAG
jgi:Tfp pilus assembly protein PilX